MSEDFLKVTIDDPPPPPAYQPKDEESDKEHPQKTDHSRGDYSHGAPPPVVRQPQSQGYGPTNPGYGPNPGGTTVIVNQPTYTSPPDTFSETPVRMRCDACHQEVTTSIHYETGMMVYIISILCCVLGLVFGCCLIPFFINSFKDVLHSCPNCRHQLGVHRRW